MISVSKEGMNQMKELLYPATAMGPPSCPMALCHREMQHVTRRNTEEYDPTNGLRYFRCPTCGHIGMVAAGGVQLVFQLAHQYVLTYEPYLSTITVLLPAGSIARCHTYRLDADALAKHAAEWALLSGHSAHTFSLAPGEQQFLDFTGYLSSRAWSTLSNQPLANHSNVEPTKSEELVRV